jgi:hypothetical protein
MDRCRQYEEEQQSHGDEHNELQHQMKIHYWNSSFVQRPRQNWGNLGDESCHLCSQIDSGAKS